VHTASQVTHDGLAAE